jgi:RNA 3'-terminal phosphate cyclase (ATP)
VALPALLFGGGDVPRSVTITGGTNVGMSPQVEYLDRVFSPIAARMGVHFGIEVLKRGYFPTGGGKVRLSVLRGVSEPLAPICLTDRGTIASVDITVWFGGKMPRHVPDKIMRRAKGDLEAGLIARDLRTYLT